MSTLVAQVNLREEITPYTSNQLAPLVPALSRGPVVVKERLARGPITLSRLYQAWIHLRPQKRALESAGSELLVSGNVLSGDELSVTGRV